MAATRAGGRPTSLQGTLEALTLEPVWHSLSHLLRGSRQSSFLSQPLSTCLLTLASGEEVVESGEERRVPASGIYLFSLQIL